MEINPNATELHWNENLLRLLLSIDNLTHHNHCTSGCGDILFVL